MQQGPAPVGQRLAVIAHACPACGVVTVWRGEHTAGDALPPTGTELGQAACPQCGYAGAEAAVAWGREIRSDFTRHGAS